MNVYHAPQYQAFRQERAFVFSDEHLSSLPGRLREFPEGWSVWTSYYTATGKYPIRGARHRLMDAGEGTVYTWDNLDFDGELYELIAHANGKHFLIFREDLYGYSVLEIETGQALHYMPGASFPLGGEKAQETFIWTGAEYDPGTSLLAVSGCYWACPNGTLLLDFSEPLEEQDCGQWLNIQNAVDPDYDRYDSIELERFGEDGLIYFKAFSAEDGKRMDFTLPADRIAELIREKKST